MSYIQSVYDRLADNIIELIDDYEPYFEYEWVVLNGRGSACWVIWFGETQFYITPLCTDSNYLASDLIAIGELVNAMNDIAHKDFMEALSESENLDAVFDKASNQFLDFLDSRGGS